MLTRKQAQVLEFVETRTRIDGYCPDLREIARGIGCSKTAVHSKLARLSERGFVRIKPGSRRAIEVIRRPLGLTRDAEVECPASFQGALRDAWIAGYRAGMGA